MLLRHVVRALLFAILAATYSNRASASLGASITNVPGNTMMYDMTITGTYGAAYTIDV